MTKQQAIALIKRELYGEFNDIKKSQLLLLLRYFKKQPMDRPASAGLLGTDFFHVIWEDMCGVFLGSQNTAVGYPAVPSYSYESQENVQDTGGQGRPDILLLDESHLGIVDAKYYDLSSTKPAWTDLVKQFFYAKAFTHRDQYQSIQNTFAVPDTNGKLPVQAHVVDVELGVSLDEEFPPIRIIYIDVVEIMTHYVANRVNVEVRKSALGKLETI